MMARISKRCLAICLAALMMAFGVSAARAAAPQAGEKMIIFQLPSNAFSGNNWTYVQSGKGAVSEGALEEYEAWQQQIADQAKRDDGMITIVEGLIPGNAALVFKGEKEGVVTLRFTYSNSKKKNAKPELAYTAKVKVYADKTLSVISLEDTTASLSKAKAAFTVNDFAYLPGFPIAQDKQFKKAFRCPGYDDIVNGLGKPLSDSGLVAFSRKLEYDFGTVTLDYEDDGSVSALWFDIRNDTLPGPRNIFVGDSYEEVLASFKNVRKSTPKTSSKDIDLYRVAKRQLGMVSYDNATGGTLAPENIYYWHGNGSRFSCSVQFFIQDGFVSDILWRIDPRA